MSTAPDTILGQLGNLIGGGGEMYQSGNSRLTLLIVDDFAGWRTTVRNILVARPEWNIIGEASDGQEAIEKATEMQPDIILLDVGMPSLNGIEAAKGIRVTSPNSRIVFVTNTNDADIKNVALATGAQGYVLKVKAGTDLLPAIDAVLNRHRLQVSQAD